jgi:hypothetical protein
MFLNLYLYNMKIDFNNYLHYRAINEPVSFDGFELIGYFPYATAGIYDTVRVPRTFFKEMEKAIRDCDIIGNKIVLIFKDNTNFGTQNFALYLKDSFGSLGKWEDVQGYAGKPLALK